MSVEPVTATNRPGADWPCPRMGENGPAQQAEACVSREKGHRPESIIGRQGNAAPRRLGATEQHSLETRRAVSLALFSSFTI